MFWFCAHEVRNDRHYNHDNNRDHHDYHHHHSHHHHHHNSERWCEVNLSLLMRFMVHITPRCIFLSSTPTLFTTLPLDEQFNILLHHFYVLYPSQAAEMGLWETGWCALRVLRHGLQAAAGVTSFFMSNTQVKYQVSCFYLYSNPVISHPDLNLTFFLPPCSSYSQLSSLPSLLLSMSCSILSYPFLLSYHTSNSHSPLSFS